MVFAVASSGFATSSVEGFRHQRSESRLRMEWRSATPGHWRLKTKNGRVCGHGNFDTGAFQHSFAKISNAEELTLEIEQEDESGAKVTEAYSIAAKQKLSPLPKKEQGARIYQLAVRTFLASGSGSRNAGRLSYLTEERLLRIKELGTDYIWLTGVLEHATPQSVDPDVVKGNAGSYYAVYDNWDVSAQIGDLDEFSALVERAHKVGLRVLMDFVANHTARVHRTDIACKESVDFGRSDRKDRPFDAQNNYYYTSGDQKLVPPYQANADGVDGIFDIDLQSPGIQAEVPAKVTGNDVTTYRPSISDWFETVKLNYGYDLFGKQPHYSPTPRTWLQMTDVAKYWLQKGVDGFRVDFAHAVPMEFWRYFAGELKNLQPNVFLLAEAYEKDAMRLPGFSYQALFQAGFDSVYNSTMYWRQREQAQSAGTLDHAGYLNTPAGRPEVLRRGYSFTHYVENHDELRTASRHFAPGVATKMQRAELGFNYSVYAALLPGHFLLHGGQELTEDAGVFGNFAGDNGRTSIFDFVYQQYIRRWLYEGVPSWMREFRAKYQKLLNLKGERPFRRSHSYERSSFRDLIEVNRFKAQSPWVAAYVRYDLAGAYIVVSNSDPNRAHSTTLHFTEADQEDTHAILASMGINNDDRRYLFVEVLNRDGWIPKDPNISGSGVPGWVLYRSGEIPSGFHIGEIPAATTYVFKVVPLD